MAAGKQQQQQQQQGQGVVAASAEPGAARRLWRVVRAVLYMLRRGLPSGRKLAMDLHLLLHRGKIAGRALGELFLAFHHGSHGHGHGRHAAAAFSYEPSGGGAGAFSCRALDPSLAVHEPAPRRARREVEFSCSNTPSSATGGGLGLGLLGGKRRRRQHHHRGDAGGYLQYYSYPDAAEVARMFELLNDDDGEHRRVFSGGDDDSSEPATASASAATSAAPSPAARMLHWAASCGGSPAVSSRTPRGGVSADSPAQVDRRADEFIRRFYDQLRAQRSAASTPDYYGYNANAAAATSRSPRPVLTAGGIA